ncbi:MAG: hypothetical protein WEG56_04780 [Chloroflexota bacterium]
MAVVLAASVVGGALGVAAIATDTFGAGQRWESVVARVDRFIAGPVPDRPAPSTRLITEPPPTPVPSATPPASADPEATPTATPVPTAEPVREPIDIDTVFDPGDFFASQDHKDWCAVAGTQMVLALHDRADTSVATQKGIASRVREWESLADSRNGDWGPSAMALALEAYGVPGYEVRAFESRQGALRDAARTIQATGAPVILLAWRGAHTWIMTGFRADADPTIFRDARVTGTYILDPWYPRISSIWGPSDPPGTFQDEAEMERNFLRWKRPEGAYPDRDGLFITVAPTIAITSPAG